MSIYTAHYTVGLDRVKIVEADTNPQHVCIHNHEHSSNANVYIGGFDVTVNNGIHAQPTLTSQITIGPGDDLWAVSDTADQELHILVIKQDS